MRRRDLREAAGRASLTDGLRAIRRFERVNGIAYNPKDRQHRMTVKDCGEDERFFRRARRVLRNAD